MHRITHRLAALAVGTFLGITTLPGPAGAGIIEGDEELDLLDGKAGDRGIQVWDDTDIVLFDPADGESADDLADSVWFDIDRLAASTTVIDADTVAIGRVQLVRVDGGVWSSSQGGESLPTETFDTGTVDLAELLEIAVGVHDDGLNDSQLMDLEARLDEMAQASMGRVTDDGSGADAFFGLFREAYEGVADDQGLYDRFFDVFFDVYAEAGGVEGFFDVFTEFEASILAPQRDLVDSSAVVNDFFDVFTEIAEHPPADLLDGALDGGHSVDGAPALNEADALIAALLLPVGMSSIAAYLLQGAEWKVESGEGVGGEWKVEDGGK